MKWVTGTEKIFYPLISMDEDPLLEIYFVVFEAVRDAGSCFQIG
jgi:hypothetical protein